MAASADNASILHAGELEIRLGEGLVLATGRALTLSVREFELLAAMARRAGAIVTRGELYAEVWGGELRSGDRSVDVYVSKLRSKLESAMPDRRFIHTHPGFGYRFQPQPAREPSAGAGAADGADGLRMTGATGATDGRDRSGAAVTGAAVTASALDGLDGSRDPVTAGSAGAGAVDGAGAADGADGLRMTGATGATDGADELDGAPGAEREVEQLSRNVHIVAIGDS